jgi:hypothetical protein
MELGQTVLFELFPGRYVEGRILFIGKDPTGNFYKVKYGPGSFAIIRDEAISELNKAKHLNPPSEVDFDDENF